MRSLTPEELALAPEWACKYFIDDNNEVIYSDKNSTTVSCGKYTFPASLYGKMSVQHLFKPINRKPFDITQHEWSDNCISVERSNTDADQIRLDNDMYLVDIERKDAIAIAKHFKLTAEDLW